MTPPSGPPAFPVARWGEYNVAFSPAPVGAADGCTFVVVFARHGIGFVLADIPGRGWITPSGRLEPGETPRQAAVRETREEIGAEIEALEEIGVYTLQSETGTATSAAAFTGWVGEYGRIPEGSESRGVRLALMEELPAIYWHWDPLLAAMFEYAASRPRAGQT